MMGMSIFLVEAAAGQEFAVWAKGHAVHRLLMSETEQHIIRHFSVGSMQFWLPQNRRPDLKLNIILISNKKLLTVDPCCGSGTGRIGTILADPDPYPFQQTRKFQNTVKKIQNYVTFDVEEKDKKGKLAVLRIKVQKVLILQIV